MVKSFSPVSLPKVIIVFIKYRNINNAKVGEVYEKVNGEYVYNPEITMELNKIIKDK